MATTYMGDICVTTGKYMDNQGRERSRFERIGAWFQDDQGRISIKITMIPILPSSGDNAGFFASLFPKQNGQVQAPQSRQTTNRPPSTRTMPMDEGVPF